MTKCVKRMLDYESVTFHIQYFKEKSYSCADKQTMGVKCPNKYMASGAYSWLVIIYVLLLLKYISINGLPNLSN